jgi:hypothetical protein
MLHSRKPLIVAYSVFFDSAEILEIPPRYSRYRRDTVVAYSVSFDSAEILYVYAFI